MPRDAVSRTANVERNGGQKWVNGHSSMKFVCSLLSSIPRHIFIFILKLKMFLNFHFKKKNFRIRCKVYIPIFKYFASCHSSIKFSKQFHLGDRPYFFRIYFEIPNSFWETDTFSCSEFGFFCDVFFSTLKIFRVSSKVQIIFEKTYTFFCFHDFEFITTWIKLSM